MKKILLKIVLLVYIYCNRDHLEKIDQSAGYIEITIHSKKVVVVIVVFFSQSTGCKKSISYLKYKIVILIEKFF